jgi:hypothetical protein
VCLQRRYVGVAPGQDGEPTPREYAVDSSGVCPLREACDARDEKRQVHNARADFARHGDERTETVDARMLVERVETSARSGLGHGASCVVVAARSS